MIMAQVLIILLTLWLTGCSLAPSDKVMEQFSQNERSWCVSITSVYGTMRMGGTGVQGGSMKCTQEGLQVEDAAARVGVPILVTPTISVGPAATTPR